MGNPEVVILDIFLPYPVSLVYTFIVRVNT